MTTRKTLALAATGWLVAVFLGATMTADALHVGPFRRPVMTLTPISLSTEPPTFICQEKGDTASYDPFGDMLAARGFYGGSPSSHPVMICRQAVPTDQPPSIPLPSSVP